LFSCLLDYSYFVACIRVILYFFMILFALASIHINFNVNDRLSMGAMHSFRIFLRISI